MIVRLREMYEGETAQAQRFRYGLLLFDLLTMVFIVATSFLKRGPALETLDALFGVLIGLDLFARISISRRRWRELLSLGNLVDLIVIASFLAPIAGEGGGFLRALRTLRLLSNFRVAARLRKDSVFFRRNEDTIVLRISK